MFITHGDTATAYQLNDPDRPFIVIRLGGVMSGPVSSYSQLISGPLFSVLRRVRQIRAVYLKILRNNSWPLCFFPVGYRHFTDYVQFESRKKKPMKLALSPDKR